MQLPRHYPWPLIKIRAPLRGSIQSLRGEADPLYFPRIDFLPQAHRTGDEYDEEYQGSEAKAILAVVISSVLIACTHKQIRVVKADPRKSRRISLLSLWSLIIGTICTIIASIMGNQLHSASGFANRGDFRTTTNSSSHAILALRFVEAFMLARLLTHVLKARRGSPSSFLGQDTNEGYEMLLGEKEGAVGKESEDNTRHSKASESSIIPASGLEPFVWSARTKSLLLIPALGSLVLYSCIPAEILEAINSNQVFYRLCSMKAGPSMTDDFSVFLGKAAVQTLGTLGALLLDVFLLPQLLQVIGSEEGSPLHPFFSYGNTIGRAVAHWYEVWADDMTVWVVLEVALYFYLFCEFNNTHLARRIKARGKRDITSWRFAF